VADSKGVFQDAVRKVCAELIRSWADRRDGGCYAQQDRVVLTPDQRRLFEECADDIENGVR
jgi:hypothetical protein